MGSPARAKVVMEIRSMGMELWEEGKFLGNL